MSGVREIDGVVLVGWRGLVLGPLYKYRPKCLEKADLVHPAVRIRRTGCVLQNSTFGSANLAGSTHMDWAKNGKPITLTWKIYSSATIVI